MTAIRVYGAVAMENWRLVGLVVTLVLLPLIVNLVSSELIDWCPRLAEKLVRWAARIQPPSSRETREEEWLGILDETPGRLSKLFRAAWIAWCAPLTNREAQGLPPLHEALRLRCAGAAARWWDRTRLRRSAAWGQPWHDRPGPQRISVPFAGGQRLAVALPSPAITVSVALALLSIATSVLVLGSRQQGPSVSRPQVASAEPGSLPGVDPGPATSAQLTNPIGLAIDAASNLYIGDTFNHRVRRVDRSGTITTVAGSGIAGFSGDGGPATAAQLDRPLGSAVDADGNLYIADTGNHRVRRVDRSGTITTVAGSDIVGFSGDGGPATAAQLHGPQGLAVDGGGNLFIADSGNHRVRRVDRSGTITTVAGSDIVGFSGDGGPATAAQLGGPVGLAVDADGNLYIADTDPSLEETRNNDANRVRRVDPSGMITTVAGSGVAGFSGDGGPATAAQFNGPWGLTVDTDGNLYITDLANNRVRRVDPSGTITTVAGSGSIGFSGDGGPATAARLYGPWALAVDAAGDLYIADTGNQRVRRADLHSGVITTVAGSG